MKRILLLMILSCFSAVGFAQVTYYWVGGTAQSNINASGVWKTNQDGTGDSRTTPAVTDILIVDGTNIGGGTPATGTVTISLNTATTAQVKLINGANVVLVRTTTNNGTLTIANNTNLQAGLIVDGTSSLQLNTANENGNIYIELSSVATAKIEGAIKMVQSTFANSPKITSRTVGGIVFGPGASLEYNNTHTSGYPFGSVNTTDGNSSNNAVVFQAGSSLIHKSAINPFGNNSSANIIVFQPGSNLVLEAANVVNMFSGKILANVEVRNNATIDLGIGSSGENFNKIENLTIRSGATFNMRSQGVSPITGNILNDGSLGISGAVTTAQLLFMGTSPQTVSGNGTFNNLGAITVAADANVILGHSLNIAGGGQSSVIGKLNFGTYTINGVGTATNTGRFQFRTAAITSTVAATITNGSNSVTVTDFSNLNAVIGLLVTGDQIPPNTYIIGTNSNTGTFAMSNAATGNGSSLTLTGRAATCETANIGGMDASIIVNANGNINFGSGTNCIFNANTTTPFPTTGSAFGDVTFNAAATTNKDIAINGKLTLNNVKLTVREGDEVVIGTTGSFDGIFNSSAYVATQANTTTGAVGTLKVNGLNAATLIPVGTTTHYTPVTLNPTLASNFDINVFSGATANAIPNGTALTPAQKLRMVDAVWNINRTSGTGDVDVTLGWDNALEGADFSAFGNAQIGMAAYTSGAYGTFTGSGNAAANTATLTTSNFSPFIIGEANTTLPLTLISFTAKESLNSVKLDWRTTDEVNLKHYLLQHKVGDNFVAIQTVPANNKAGIFNYSYTHLNPLAGVNYYRLVGVDLDGTTHESEIKVVNVAVNKIAVYPNPVSQKNINVTGVVKGDVIKLFNIQGQVIATKTASGNQVLEIDVQNIQAGTYILSIENGGRVTNTKKVIKI